MTMPPLRDRTDDIPLLVDFYVRKITQRLGKTIEILDLDRSALRARMRKLNIQKP